MIKGMLSGDMETGKILMRDYINATIGFEELGAMMQKSPKSLMRMFGTKGNPTISNLFGVIHALQQREETHFEVYTVH